LDAPERWRLWRRITFRFIASAAALLIVLLPISGAIPPLGRLIDRIVELANARLFHVAPVIVPTNGSGDTSWAYNYHGVALILAVLATVIWSIIDARRPAYPRAEYWLRTLLRYSLAGAALVYGIAKLFALQMPFPSPSALATPLGDLLPMRFAWFFIGYSTPYQVFCGAMEAIAGVLLLSRRTVTLGLIVATAAFANVLLVNLAYDVPVKLYATQLFLTCVALLVWDARRLVRMLVLNRPVEGTTLYDPPPLARWQRIGGLVLKAGFVLLVITGTAVSAWQRSHAPVQKSVPLAVGVYEVQRFVLRGDTIPATAADSVRWHDLIIDDARGGSVGSHDARFWQRYGRGYFRYAADTTTRSLTIWRSSVTQDSTFILRARYVLRDSTHAQLWAMLGADSLYVELARTSRHFPLAERQFHWVSEYNR